MGVGNVGWLDLLEKKRTRMLTQLSDEKMALQNKWIYKAK